MRLDKVKLLTPEQKIALLVKLYSQRYHISECTNVFDCSEEIIINELKRLNIFEKSLCKKCSKWKCFSEFPKDKGYKFNIRKECRSCINDYQKQYRKDNSEAISKQRKLHYLKHKDKKKKIQREYYSNNKDKAKDYHNKIENKNRYNQRDRERRQSDEIFRISENLSCSIRNALKNGSKAGRSWKNLVDFNISELISHLKSKLIPGMNWQDYLDGKLHLDHIKPIVSFSINNCNDSDFKECWSLNNFQLLPASINIIKKDKWDGTPENVSFNLKYVTLAELQENLERF